LEEAGRVNGGSFGYTMRHILVPLMLPTMAAVAVMVFGAVSRQVGSIVLLTTSDTEPLSIMQLGYLMAEDYSAASVVGTILVGLGVLLALVVRKSRYQFGIQGGLSESIRRSHAAVWSCEFRVPGSELESSPIPMGEGLSLPRT